MVQQTFHEVNLFSSWHIIFSPIQLTPASWEWSQEWRPSPAKRLHCSRELSVPEQPSWSRKMGPVLWPNCEPLKTSTPSEVGSVRYRNIIVNTVPFFLVWPCIQNCSLNCTITYRHLLSVVFQVDDILLRLLSLWIHHHRQYPRHCWCRFLLCPLLGWSLQPTSVPHQYSCQ